MRKLMPLLNSRRVQNQVMGLYCLLLIAHAWTVQNLYFKVAFTVYSIVTIIAVLMVLRSLNGRA